MYRRSITNEERKKLVELGLSQHVLASSVSLLKASEVEDIIEGNDEKLVYVAKIKKNFIRIEKKFVSDTKQSQCIQANRQFLEKVNRKNQCHGYLLYLIRVIWTLYRKQHQ